MPVGVTPRLFGESTRMRVERPRFLASESKGLSARLVGVFSEQEFEKFLSIDYPLMGGRKIGKRSTENAPRRVTVPAAPSAPPGADNGLPLQFTEFTTRLERSYRKSGALGSITATRFAIRHVVRRTDETWTVEVCFGTLNVCGGMGETKRKGSGGTIKRESFDIYWSGVDQSQQGCRGVDFIRSETLSECAND
ncbi:hypothetical protein EVAR_46424_1 [Eumeta japonica]|uniref:Uncharacterized protein n=1 Tax=Eumeta variegata TaxID=151549 RepID=A0A4C1XEF2_EUMVA|nr:hypothetical protein EVAR_46424_1 [Eumeta japonica]